MIKLLAVSVFIFFLSILSCHKSELSLTESTVHPTPTDLPAENRSTIIESFSDDSQIARPGKNKIQIDIAEGQSTDIATPNNVAVIRFYSLTTAKNWVWKQTLELETHALMDSYPEIKDFNNDGFKDVTFISGTAARGSNEIRTLLIYDKINDDLVHIKNSEDYPNLAYNKTLNCIDSWMVHGASTTAFLHLEGDELKEFASVGTGADSSGECCELVVNVIDETGKKRVIKRERITQDDIYTRFSTFDPPSP